jgi:hypothetical protein
MYLKVALITISILAFNACSNSLNTKPKAPSVNSKNLGIQVVEQIEEEYPISTVENEREVVKQTTTPKRKKVKKHKTKTYIPTPTKTKKKKKTPKAYKEDYLKPEPFSLESDENDPELLGPQTTLDKPLQRNYDTVEEEATTEVE